MIDMVAWNINGWGGTEKRKAKAGHIRSEISSKQVVVLTETHIRDEEDAEDLEKSLGGRREWVFGHAIGHKSTAGVTVMIKKRILKNGEDDVVMEVDAAGRWVICKIKNLMEDEVVIVGLYAPATQRRRAPWLKQLEEKVKPIQGMKLMAGDLNFVMDTKIDKIGGNQKNGMSGSADQTKH